MFFRSYPADWPAAWGALAGEFGWAPSVLEDMGAEDLLFWLERLEVLVEARRAWRAPGRH